MAIFNIPSIEADSFGGYPYSLEYSNGFSSDPSTATYKVVSRDGTFTLPQIGKSCRISFDKFIFSGNVLSYEIDESNSGKILTVTVIDNSVILDRLYVVVFRQGLFGKTPSPRSINKDVIFDENEKYYWVLQGGTPVKKTLSNGTVKRSVRGLNEKIQHILLVGSEEPPDSNCELPASSYTFRDLRTAVGSSVSGFGNCPITDDKIRKTYEGTLRSVLNSWCQDFGVSFYWDFSTNSIKFLDLKSGFASVPRNASHPMITSKKTFVSMEGTYNQIAADYFAEPYNPVSVSLSQSNTYYSTFNMSPYNWWYFLDRQAGVEGDGVLYGGGRSRDNFLKSAFLGYISPTLRKIYTHSVLGVPSDVTGHTGKPKAAGIKNVTDALGLGGMADTLNDLIDFSGQTASSLGSSYYFFYTRYDEGLEAKWHDIEQDIINNKMGRFYRSPNRKGGAFKWCTATSIFSSSISYDPEGQKMEDSDTAGNIKGKTVFDRGGGGFDKEQASALKDLGLADGAFAENLEKCKPIHIELLEGSDFLRLLKLSGEGDLGGYDSLMITPRAELIQSKLGLNISLGSGSNNRETTYQEVEASQQNQDSGCSIADPTEDKCLGAKEELRKKQMKTSEQGEPKAPASGLVAKTANKAIVRVKGGKSTTIHAQSHATYRGVTTVSSSLELVLDQSKNERFQFYQASGTSLDSSDVLETRFILENRTTSENLSKNNLTPADLSSRQSYKQNKNIEKYTYTCAGFVPENVLSLKPESGLESIDLSITDNGYSATYTYSTRPPVFPRQDISTIVSESNPSRSAFQIR